MKRSLRIAALAAAVCLLCGAANGAKQPAVSARRCLVMDAGSGAVLYEKNADERSLIASTTKIMTGWLACQLVNLDAEYEIPAEAVGVEGSSIYLQAGERLSGEDLLRGMLLHSGNDAATALGHASTNTTQIYDHSEVEKALRFVRERDKTCGAAIAGLIHQFE